MKKLWTALGNELAKVGFQALDAQGNPTTDTNNMVDIKEPEGYSKKFWRYYNQADARENPTASISVYKGSGEMITLGATYSNNNEIISMEEPTIQHRYQAKVEQTRIEKSNRNFKEVKYYIMYVIDKVNKQNIYVSIESPFNSKDKANIFNTHPSYHNGLQDWFTETNIPRIVPKDALDLWPKYWSVYPDVVKDAFVAYENQIQAQAATAENSS